MYTQHNQYRVVLEVKPELGGQPRRARAALRALRDRRAGAAAPARQDPPVEDAALASPTRASSPPSRSRSTWRPASRSAGGRRHPRRGAAASACRRASTASFQGTAQAFQASLSSQPILILAALVAVYIVLGVLYESLIHPITILSTLPVRRRRRAPRAHALQDRVQHHRAHRHHPAHRHREEERHHDDRLRHRGGARARASPRATSIYKACLLRFRPILMTTLAALLGASRSRSARAPAPSCAGRSASPSSAGSSSRSRSRSSRRRSSTSRSTASPATRPSPRLRAASCLRSTFGGSARQSRALPPNPWSQARGSARQSPGSAPRTPGRDRAPRLPPRVAPRLCARRGRPARPRPPRRWRRKSGT